MADSLEKFSEEEMRPKDSRGRFPDILRLMQFVNACLNPQILTNTGRNFLSFSSSNLTLELDQSGTDGTVASLTPWQPYAAPYLGAGTAPADWGLNIMLRPGVVWDGLRLWIPARKNIVIPVPADCTDGLFVWLDGTVDATGALTALDYGYGTTLPGAVTPPTDGSAPPPHAFDLLMIVTSSHTAADLSAAGTFVMRNTPLALLPQDAGDSQRRMIYQPGNPVTDIPSVPGE